METLQNYQYAIDQSSIFAITDKNGIITYANDKFCEISKYTREELLGKTHAIINSGFHSKEFWKNFWRTISDGRIWRGDIQNRAKDGSIYWVDSTIVPFMNDEGKIEKYFAIRNDITDKKDLEDKVIHQDRLASIGLMASGMAHEIGTPLGVIRGRAEFLQMNTDDDLTKKYLNVIIEQSDRVSRLISTLLRLSRSGDDIKILPLNLETIIDDVLVLLEEKLRRREIKIIKKMLATQQVLGDRYRIEQVLMNLLINALHAVEADKKDNKEHLIEVRTENKRDGVEECSVSPNRRHFLT